MIVICLLLFTGAVGKSAQFPLHVWLPGAMEGPSPVSALIHAATMVTAGVYMVARCTPLFVQAPEAQMVVAGVGGLTVILAALIAITQNDLKRVLAYSTVSQLGFMFMALGCAPIYWWIPRHEGLIAVAVTAAIFHLFTHAFFKALLFLGAGSVMHAMGDVIDMRRFGGLRHRLKYTHWAFLCGAAGLAGVPLLSGWWSKDEIISSLLQGFLASQYGLIEPEKWSDRFNHAMLCFAVLIVVALLTTFFTAFYTFRAYFKTFWGEERFPPEAGGHPHESPRVMLIPLMILAAGALLVGVFFGPTHLFAGYLEKTPSLPAVESSGHNPMVMIASSFFALAGFGVAWQIYLKRPEVAKRRSKGTMYMLSANKFYLDEIYNALIVAPIRGFATLCRVLDQHIVDGLVDLVGAIPALFGRLFRPVQNGLVQFYALAMILGLTVLMVALVTRLSR